MRTLLLATIVALIGCGQTGPVETETIWGVERARPYHLLMELQGRGVVSDADVNRDGVIDIQDLVIVSQNFGMAVEIGSLHPVGAIPWTSVDGFPWAQIEIQNTGSGPVEMMRIRYIARGVDGLLIDVEEGSLVTALEPVPGEHPTYLPPGARGRAKVWATAITVEDMETGRATLKLVFVENEQSTIPDAP
jgi:hypothetical protein